MEKFSATTLSTDCSVDSENSQLSALRQATAPLCACVSTGKPCSWVPSLAVRRVSDSKDQSWKEIREGIWLLSHINIINNLQNICLCCTIGTQKTSVLIQVKLELKTHLPKKIFCSCLLAFSNPPSIFIGEAHSKKS